MRVCPQCGYRAEERICPRDGLPMVEERLVENADKGPDLEGRLFGDRYQLDRLIGRGGMGWVFRATHLVMQQTVALKVMRRELTRDLPSIKRFYQEARACSLLKHHNTIKVHDFGVTDDGYPYIVMEYLEGHPLNRVLKKEGPLGPRRAIHIARRICKSLDEAHERGLVHRDLKPANIFLTEMHGEPDYVKVLDFGIAKFVEGERREETLTQTGMVFGTPKYLSPEQAQAIPLDRRSDLYSLGVILFEMVVGKVPFDAESTGALLVKQINEPPPPIPETIDDAEVPSELRAFISMLLSKHADERPATAREAEARLAAIQEGRAFRADEGRSDTDDTARRSAARVHATDDGGADHDAGTMLMPDATGERSRVEEEPESLATSSGRPRRRLFAIAASFVALAAIAVALALGTGAGEKEPAPSSETPASTTSSEPAVAQVAPPTPPQPAVAPASARPKADVVASSPEDVTTTTATTEEAGTDTSSPGEAAESDDAPPPTDEGVAEIARPGGSTPDAPADETLSDKSRERAQAEDEPNTRARAKPKARAKRRTRPKAKANPAPKPKGEDKPSGVHVEYL